MSFRRIQKMATAGFTLIEVLVALFILTGAIIVISTAWSGNFMRIRKANMFNDVATLLEQKMQEVDAKYRAKQLSEIPEEEKGDFGTANKQFRWELKSKDLKFPDISPILTSQEGGADETLLSMVKQMTEYLSTTVKEVKVSVFAKGAKGNEVEFSAVQYFIDYNKEFSGLPAGAGEKETNPAGNPPPGEQ